MRTFTLVALVALAACSLTLTSVPRAPAADDNPASAAPSAPAESETALDLFEEIKDTGFARYVDLEQLAAAWVDLDPNLMTDVALQLAEGERVLQRGHKSGVTSQRLLDVAVRIASERRDKDSLDRLGRIAASRKDDNLTSKTEAAKKTLTQPRESALGKLSVEDTSPEDLAAMQATLDQIRRHKLVGNVSGLAAMEARMADETDHAATSLRRLTQDATASVRAAATAEVIAAAADPTATVLLSISAASEGNGSNRDEVRARVAAGGWTVLWGVNINEAEYLKFVAAIAASVVSGNPAGIQAYLSDYLERTYLKVKGAFPSAARDAVIGFLLKAIKSGSGETKFGNVGVKAGLATYQRWYTVSVRVPDGLERYKIRGPFGTWTWGYRPKFKTVEKKIPLPNHHTPYVAFRL